VFFFFFLLHPLNYARWLRHPPPILINSSSLLPTCIRVLGSTPPSDSVSPLPTGIRRLFVSVTTTLVPLYFNPTSDTNYALQHLRYFVSSYVGSAISSSHANLQIYISCPQRIALSPSAARRIRLLLALSIPSLHLKPPILILFSPPLSYFHRPPPFFFSPIFVSYDLSPLLQICKSWVIDNFIFYPGPSTAYN